MSLRVRLDPERERRSFIGHDWEYGAWQFSAKFCHESFAHPAKPGKSATRRAPALSAGLFYVGLPASGNLRLRVNASHRRGGRAVRPFGC